VPCGQSSDSISRLRISPGPRHRFRCRGDWTSVECPVGRSGGSDSSFDHVGRRLVAACPCGTCGRGIAVRGFPLAASAAHRPPVRGGGAASDVCPSVETRQTLEGQAFRAPPPVGVGGPRWHALSFRRLFAPGIPFAGVSGLTGRLARSRPAAPFYPPCRRVTASGCQSFALKRGRRLSSGHSRGSSTNLRERVFKSFP